MYKRTMKIVFPGIIAILLQGCFDTAMQVIGGFNNVRSGYQAYQGMKGIKGYSNAKPVLVKSDILFVKTDLLVADDSETNINQDAATAICSAFNAEFTTIKVKDINNGRDMKCMHNGDVPNDAVVLNVRELVESGTAMRVIQSDTIKSESTWVAHSTGSVLDNQVNPGFKTHEELIDFVSQAMAMQIIRSVAPAESDPSYKEWGEKVQAWSTERSRG